MEPFIYLEYSAPQAKLACAVCCFSEDADIYGWYTGVQGAKYPASFFKLEDFYTVHNAVFYRSEHDDVYGGWTVVTRKGDIQINRPSPVANELCHELEHIQ